MRNMSNNTKKKQENKKLIEQLNKKSETNNKSEIAQDTQKNTEKESSATSQKASTEKTVMKERNVKDYIVSKTEKELNEDSRTVIKEHRAYMIDTQDNKTFSVFNATMYYDTNTKSMQLLTQAIAHKLVQQYVSKLKYADKFNAQNIMTLLKTCGGAYGDKVRNALFAISLYVTQAQMQSDLETCIIRAKTLKRTCIYYNTKEDSQRKFYEFIKIV